mmetsp:Transcript_77553/g.240797  ORF Transcript_77553/g.240797 Transcript_77553/m.240797 type:complete len:94 (+) Transcript_77553:34-315(+)
MKLFSASLPWSASPTRGSRDTFEQQAFLLGQLEFVGGLPASQVLQAIMKAWLQKQAMASWLVCQPQQPGGAWSGSSMGYAAGRPSDLCIQRFV